jgi:hypothetical protein
MALMGTIARIQTSMLNNRNCSGLVSVLLTDREAPIFSPQVWHLNEIATIAGYHRETVQESCGCKTKVLAANTDPLLAQLPNKCVHFLVAKQNVPCAEAENSSNKGSMILTLCALSRRPRFSPLLGQS